MLVWRRLLWCTINAIAADRPVSFWNAKAIGYLNFQAAYHDYLSVHVMKEISNRKRLVQAWRVQVGVYHGRGDIARMTQCSNLMQTLQLEIVELCKWVYILEKIELFLNLWFTLRTGWMYNNSVIIRIPSCRLSYSVLRRSFVSIFCSHCIITFICFVK
jgi:hypothetical protein